MTGFEEGTNFLTSVRWSSCSTRPTLNTPCSWENVLEKISVLETSFLIFFSSPRGMGRGSGSVPCRSESPHPGLRNSWQPLPLGPSPPGCPRHSPPNPLPWWEVGSWSLEGCEESCSFLSPLPVVWTTPHRLPALAKQHHASHVSLPSSEGANVRDIRFIEGPPQNLIGFILW